MYGKTANYFFESGHILVKTSFDNTGNDWKTGAVSWNRNCDISRSSDRNYRSAWYGDTLDSWSCWIDQQPQKSQFTGALAQLLHGCAWNAGGTVGLAWIGVACDGSFQFNNQDGRRCGGRGSVSSYASSGLYIVTTHELGHNFGLPHNTTGIMTPSAGSVTDFSRQSQHYLCDLYPSLLLLFFLSSTPSPLSPSIFSHLTLILFSFIDQAGKCATDLIAGCDCPSSWECGSLCGQQCPGLSCGSGEECINNECIVPCVPQCGGFQCGPDGCGGECGQCSGLCLLNKAIIVPLFPPVLYSPLFQLTHSVILIDSARALAEALLTIPRGLTMRGEDGVWPVMPMSVLRGIRAFRIFFPLVTLPMCPHGRVAATPPTLTFTTPVRPLPITRRSNIISMMSLRLETRMIALPIRFPRVQPPPDDFTELIFGIGRTLSLVMVCNTVVAVSNSSSSLRPSAGHLSRLVLTRLATQILAPLRLIANSMDRTMGVLGLCRAPVLEVKFASDLAAVPLTPVLRMSGNAGP